MSERECFLKNDLVQFSKKYDRLGLRIAWTVNLPDSYVPKGYGIPKIRRISWGVMTPIQQYQFFKVYIRRIVQKYVSACFCVFEFTKRGNMHMHVLAYVFTHYPEETLITIRRSVSQECMCRNIMRGKYADRYGEAKSAMRLNHIVDNTDTYAEPWQDYLMKDIYRVSFAPIRIDFDLLEVQENGREEV